MEISMDSFEKELNEGELHFRDQLQFGLKSFFSPNNLSVNNTYRQEFYIFIPNVLHVNSQTYDKKDFYRDQTNFIRFKTPLLTLSELAAGENEDSPLVRLRSIHPLPPSQENSLLVKGELSLYGNIVRSALRRRTQYLIDQLENIQDVDDFNLLNVAISQIESEINILRKEYSKISTDFQSFSKNNGLHAYFIYVDEFISQSIEYYMTGLLSHLRDEKNRSLNEADNSLCEIIIHEQKYRHETLKRGIPPKSKDEETEYTMYRRSLLNKFILDALLLNVRRHNLQKKYSHLGASFAAGVAMLFYLLLFIWQGEVFVLNSIPFVIITVFLYILKDRLKEGIRALYQKKAFRWFPDYSTDIRTFDERKVIGKLIESFAFLASKDLPKNIRATRDEHFNTLLESFRRPETILYYKRDIDLHPQKSKRGQRRRDLNMIFRFNIHQFLQKASNPFSTHVVVDPKTKKLKSKKLAKVYHLNIIMVSQYTDKNASPQKEIKKFRVVIDKRGIKRVNTITSKMF